MRAARFARMSANLKKKFSLRRSRWCYAMGYDSVIVSYTASKVGQCVVTGSIPKAGCFLLLLLGDMTVSSPTSG